MNTIANAQLAKLARLINSRFEHVRKIKIAIAKIANDARLNNMPCRNAQQPPTPFVMLAHNARPDCNSKSRTASMDTTEFATRAQAVRWVISFSPHAKALLTPDAANVRFVGTAKNSRLFLAAQNTTASARHAPDAVTTSTKSLHAQQHKIASVGIVRPNAHMANTLPLLAPPPPTLCANPAQCATQDISSPHNVTLHGTLCAQSALCA